MDLEDSGSDGKRGSELISGIRRKEEKSFPGFPMKETVLMKVSLNIYIT